MKKLIFRLLYVSGVVRAAAWLNRRRVMVLCYHGVTERTTRNPKDHFGLHVRHDRFLAHLDFLRRHYRIVSLEDYLTSRPQAKALPDYSVVLTFDDGYRNFFTAAAPRLAAQGMTASVFLITDRVRNDEARVVNNWVESDDETYLSWAEAQQLSQQGFEFGSHTCSHLKLPELSMMEIEHELRDSSAGITRQLKTEAIPLAYPYGLASHGIATTAKSLGYVCALTTDTGFIDGETNLFMLNRTLIGDDDDVAAFATRVSGLTRWLSRGSALW
ncbi:MAG: polysaccharide deacetylase family protein [Acidobacteriota bacterium]|nr:polysaccharide deacetylase family protein [Acidobacteriota bacterium]